MLTPRLDYVVIREDQPEEKTDSGILLVAELDAPSELGTVVASGPDTDIKEGARVLFKHHGFHEVEYEGETLLIGKQEHVLALL